VSRVLVALVTAFLFVASVSPAEVYDRADRDAPIQITAEIMSGDLAAGLTVFEKNVVIVQGTATIRADRVEIRSRPQGEGGTGGADSPDSMTAIGNVSFHQEAGPNRRELDASGERGVFDRIADTVTMTGNPKLWQGKNVVTGDELIFRIGTDQYEVKGQPDRKIKAVFYPQPKATPTPATAP
jgi:lipopolysaccharide export system protein LptA